MKKTVLLVLVVAVVVGGLAFYGGMKYGQGKVSQRFAQMGANGGSFRGTSGQGRTGTGGMNVGFVSGTILSKDANSITVQLRNLGAAGSNNGTGSKIVFLSTSTEIGKTVSGTLNDLSVGQSVTVTGSANSDGSVTAQSVQIRPNMPSPSPAK